MVTRTEVQKHASKQSCWVILNGTAYDLTSFVDAHPGGSAIILKYAGRDATQVFERIHPSDTLDKYLKPDQNMGPVSGPEPAEEKPVQVVKTDKQATDQKKRYKLSAVVNIRDFEKAASYNLDPKAYAFFRTGADDEYTARWNQRSWQSVRFRPRILRPINKIDLSTTILGTNYSTPFFICPAGGGKLAHPKGEVLMTKAAAKHDTLHWVCNMAGCTQLEMAEARAPNQTTFWQIYATSDISITEREIRQAVERGYKGFALTVDAIRAGKRERDLRLGVDEFEFVDEAQEEDESLASGGVSAIRAPVWSSFDWRSAITWIRGLTSLPIAIKGIQCWEDAALCMEHGVHPWLSNHGGRQLEGAPSAIETLVEIRQHCPKVFEKCDVIVDGGVTRGTDIVKALALGAKAVGLGRPFLYSLSYGEAGVSKAIGILKQEMEIAMSLLGVERIEDLGPEYVDTSALASGSSLRAHL